MNSLKSLFLTLAVVLSAHSALTAANGICLSYDKPDGFCGACLRSKFDPKTKLCGPLVPETDGCQLYGRLPKINKDICDACKPGYELTTKTSLVNLYCVKSANPIKNCFNALNIGGAMCEKCIGGIPSQDNKSCISWEKVANPIKNCKVGALDLSNNGRPKCYICEGNLTFDDKTRKCQPNPSNVGCLETSYDGPKMNQAYCVACNGFEGYAMDATGACHKVNQLA